MPQALIILLFQIYKFYVLGKPIKNIIYRLSRFNAYSFWNIGVHTDK